MTKYLLKYFFDKQLWKICTNENEAKRHHHCLVALFLLFAQLITLLTFGRYVWYGNTVAIMKFSVEERS